MTRPGSTWSSWAAATSWASHLAALADAARSRQQRHRDGLPHSRPARLARNHPDGGHSGGGHGRTQAPSAPTMVRQGAVVIDVGINRVDDAFAPPRLSAGGRRGLRTRWPPKPKPSPPSPGGIGPMTIAMLLKNTVEAARHTRQERSATPWKPPDATRIDYGVQGEPVISTTFLPEERIAQTPAEPRDSSRLLALDPPWPPLASIWNIERFRRPD